MKKSFKIRIEYISIAVIVISLLVYAYLIFLDGTVINPVDVYDQPKIETITGSDYFTPMPMGDVGGVYSAKTDKLSYKEGEEVFITLSFCKYRGDQAPIVKWSFIDDRVVSLDYRNGNISETGCYRNIRVLVGTIPPANQFSDSSKISLHGTISYKKINPFRTVSYLIISNNFSIEK